MTSLFSPEFVETISRLRIVAKQVPRGGRHADQVSAQLGSGMEFRDFRAYVPGDDFRRIDWNLYKRSGMLFLRLFEEFRDLPVYVLVDCSDSMFFGEPPRADTARQIAAAMAAASLNQHDQVGIYPFGRDLLKVPLRKITSLRSLPAVLDYLEKLTASGSTDLVGAIKKFNMMNLRRGLVVLVSDFFDLQGIEAINESLRSLKHRLLLVQVSRTSDPNPELLPELTGEIELTDCENAGVSVQTSVTPQVLKQYRLRYQEFQKELLAFVNRRQAGYLMLDAQKNILEQIREIFENGIFMTQR